MPLLVQILEIDTGGMVLKGKGFTDFTEGNISRHLLAFTLPMLAGNALQAMYNMVDSIWVGRYLGPAGLAAVSVSFPIIFALISLVMGLTMATTTIVSQYFGAKNEAMVKRTVNNSITLLFVAAVMITIIGIVFRYPILRLINTPEAIIADAASYLLVFMAGLIFMFLYNVLSAILRGLGDSRTPLLFLVYSTVINIILDPLMILGVGPFPRMGVAGAALATVIAQGVSAYLGIRYLNKVGHMLSFRFRDLNFDRDLTKLTLRIGLPAGIQQMVVSLGNLTISSFINSFGQTVVAAYGAAGRLDQFAFMPAMSLGVATSAFVGQNLGAGKEERVKETVRSSLLQVTLFTLPAVLLALFAPRALLSLFTNDQEVLRIGAGYLRIAAFSYFPFAWMFVYNGVLRGAGDTLPTMFFTIGSLWVVRVPLARYLSSLPGLGVRGIWWGIAISPIFGLVLSVGYYLTGRWKKVGVVRRQQGGPQPPLPDEL